MADHPRADAGDAGGRPDRSRPSVDARAALDALRVPFDGASSAGSWSARLRTWWAHRAGVDVGTPSRPRSADLAGVTSAERAGLGPAPRAGRWWLAAVAVVVAAAIGAGAAVVVRTGASPSAAASSVSRPVGPASLVGPDDDTTGGPSRTRPGAPGSQPAGVVVHVAGAVVAPGVHRLADGARVSDAVAAAGGLAPDADADRVNLAAPVTDGSRVYVPHRGESSVPSAVAAEPPTGGATSGPGATGPNRPVNINTAGAAELDVLPGVGPSTAAAIIEYRTAHGPFRTVDDLAKVRGIGPARLDQLRRLVTV